MTDYKKELKDFSYIVSHELNAPVRHIKQFGQLLSNSMKDDATPEKKEYLGYMEGAAHKIEAMLAAILTYSRLNTTERQIVPVDFNAALEDALSKHYASDVKVTTTSLPTALMADHIQIQCLFLYLVDNAFKFKAPDVPLSLDVTSEKKQDHWLFCVKDNGIGLKSKDTEKLFTIFNREHPSTEYEGIGTGLTFAKKIIDLHNGKIWLESTGDGTSVYFTLPL